VLDDGQVKREPLQTLRMIHFERIVGKETEKPLIVLPWKRKREEMRVCEDGDGDQGIEER
jgi:hypothetical protein